jgi:hypothetical protein
MEGVDMRRLTFGPVRLCLAALFMLHLGGCSPPEVGIKLSADPPVVRPGGQSTISVVVTNPPPDISYLWKPGRGKCSPTSSAEKFTTYTAPEAVGDDYITLDIVRNGTNETLIAGGVAVQVSDQAPTPTPTRTPTPKPNGTPPPPPPLSIRITEVPVKDCAGGQTFDKAIGGEVSGANPLLHSVVLYAFTNVWYVQPTKVGYLTEIGADGKWANMINGGCIYAALLVESAKFKMVSEVHDLPRAGVLTSDKKEGRESPRK